MSTIQQHTYDNGLTLLVEPMPGVQSVGMAMLLPGGTADEPADQLGLYSVLCEMLHRGAGDRDARAHSEALDQLGVKRGTDVRTQHVRLDASILSERLPTALPLLFDMIRRPHLSDEGFGPARELALQAIEALEDEPQQKVMIELKQRHLPEPFGRSSLGRRKDLQQLTAAQVRAGFAERSVSQGAILSLAGAVDFETTRDQVGELLGDWSGSASEAVESASAERGTHHVPAESAQQHIGVAYDALPENDPMSMTQRVGIAVLSGGMSGRLFTEVREKRGLCYAVAAQYAATRDRGSVFGYAGTTTQRAAETLEVMVAELKRVCDGVDEDEFQRAIVGLKSRVVMQGESTSARANALANDFYVFGRPRALEEVAAEIDAVSLDGLNQFLDRNRPDSMTVLNIGSEPLSIPTT